MPVAVRSMGYRVYVLIPTIGSTHTSRRPWRVCLARGNTDRRR